MRCNPPLTPLMGRMSSLWISIKKKKKKTHTHKQKESKKKPTSNTHDTTNASLHLLRGLFPQFHKSYFFTLIASTTLLFPQFHKLLFHSHRKYYLIFKLVDYCTSFAVIYSQAHKQVDQSTQNTHNGHQPEHIIFILVSIFYNKIMDFLFPNLPYMKPPKITPSSNIKL